MGPDRRSLAWFSLPVGLYWLLLAAPTALGLSRYCFSYYDLGIYAQGVSRLAEGELNPWLSGRQLHLFNDHFDPIVWLAVAPSFVMPPAWAAWLTEHGVVSSSALAFVWLVRRGELRLGTGVLLSSMVLLNASTWQAAIFPVHPTTWAVAPMVWLFAGLLANHRRVVVIALIALLACKEEFPLFGLALGLGMLASPDSRRWGAMVSLISLGWLALIFGARTLGPGQGGGNYVASLLADWDQGAWQFFVARWNNGVMEKEIGGWLLVGAPVALFLFLDRARPRLAYLTGPGALIGIRFLAKRWSLHYGAVVAASLVGVLMTGLRQKRLPKWVFAGVFLALIASNTRGARFAYEAWTRGDIPQHAGCPAEASRLASIESGVRYLESRPGRTLVGTNLAAFVLPRDEIYVPGGLQSGRGLIYEFVFVEVPPHGSEFPSSFPAIQRNIDAWRRAPEIEVVIDDGLVFLAKGRFTGDS